LGASKSEEIYTLGSRFKDVRQKRVEDWVLYKSVLSIPFQEFNTRELGPKAATIRNGIDSCPGRKFGALSQLLVVAARLRNHYWSIIYRVKLNYTDLYNETQYQKISAFPRSKVFCFLQRLLFVLLAFDVPHIITILFFCKPKPIVQSQSTAT
jgi:hypothetical protein